MNDLHHQWSRSKVKVTQGQIDLLGHISMNIHRINFKQKPLGLCESLAPMKVKGQGHPRSRLNRPFWPYFNEY